MIKRVLTWFIAAFAFALLSQAQAKLPFNAFKNVSKHFHNVYYSPVLGMSALESGIITAIRFVFVEKELINTDNGLRIFVEDKITNQHGNIAKILFPSVTGELGIDTNAQVTLSTHATPEFMATIMAVTSKVRQLAQSRQEEVDHFLDIVWENFFFKATGSGKKQTKSGVLAEVKMVPKDRNKLKTQITQLFAHIAQAIIEEEKQASLLPKYTVEQLISAFVCTKLNSRDELEEYLIALYLQDSDHLIFKDLSAYSDTNSKRLFADVALFDQKDKAGYVEVLNTILHPTSEAVSTPPSEVSFSSPVPSPPTLGGHSRIIDALYALTVMPYLHNPTPYINAAPSHGPTGFVDGIDAIIDHKRGTFSDCNENSLRVLLNLMTFDAIKREFNLAFLEKARGPRVEILREFYRKYQDVTNVGSTSQYVRTQWNRVVGDLNSLLSVDLATIPLGSSSSSTQDITTSTARVRYLQGNNELDSGFANILRVFEKVFGISLLPSFPKTGDIDEQIKAIQQGFMALFKFIAPGSQVEITFNNLQSKPGDLAGYMTVTVDNQFQFTLYEDMGTHGHVENIKSLIPQSSIDQEYLTLLNQYDNLLQNETFATLLLLQQNRKKLIYNQFYTLFSTPIHGNHEILSFIEKLAKLPDDDRFNLPLKFVLKQIAWDDFFSRQSLFETLERMLGRSYDQTIFDGIRYFKVSEKYPISYVEANMKNLRDIEFSDESYVNIQHVMPSISEIFLPDRAQLPLDFSKLPSLEGLDLYNTQIPSLEFKQPMLNLKVLILPSTIAEWSQVHGIENLQALEEMDLSFAQLTSLELTQPMPNLWYIALPQTINDWSEVRGIENLTALRKMDLRYTQITSLIFTKPMLNLKHLIFPQTLTQVDGFETLPALEEMDLSFAQLTSLELTQPMPNLKTILLPRTMQSCTLHDKKENWEIKQLDVYGNCQVANDKRTMCLDNPNTVKFSFLGDSEGPTSSSSRSN